MRKAIATRITDFPRKKRQWLFRRDRAPHWLVIVCCALLVLAGLFIGIDLAWSQLTVDNKPFLFAVLPPLLPAIFQAIVAVSAGVLAWLQFDRTHRQREEQFRRKELQDREHFEKTQKQAEDQFRSKELQDQFADIQNRVAATRPSIRASATLRLGEFATRLQPGRKEGDPRTEANNPYFVPAASQLVTALYLEPNQDVRKAIFEAIKNLIAFAKAGDGQSLLHILIERLVD